MSRTFDPKETIPAFDRFLESRKISFTAIAVGGAALSILGIISRGTGDLDLLETSIPTDVQLAAKEFAIANDISETWLNNGPASLARDLPLGWRNRIQQLYFGKSLKLWTLSRMDLIRSKFWAMCDRLRDVDDLIALAPSLEEIALAVDWVKPLDANPNWPAYADKTADILKARLGYEK